MQKSYITNRTRINRQSNSINRQETSKRFRFSDLISLKSAVTLGLLLTITIYVVTYCELKSQTCIYEYTSVPEELKKKGFTDDLLTRVINDILYRINTYTDDIRNNLTTKKDRPAGIKFTANSNPSYVSSIQNMNIEGVPFKALIHFTDKVLNVFPININDNYVTVEFYSDSQTVHASVLFRGSRRAFSEHFDHNNPRSALFNLCYNISITILEQSNPLALCKYYYNIGEFGKCIEACMAAVTTKKYTDSDKSQAFLFWALALNREDRYFAVDNVKLKINEAIKLDSSNSEARLILYSLKSTNAMEYDSALRKLVRQDSMSYQYWAALLSQRASYEEDCEAFAKRQDRLFVKMKKKLKGSAYPSEIFYRYGRNLRVCGDLNPVWYDSAIARYSEAIDAESSISDTDFRKLAHYYNSLAYAFESKALALSGNKINECMMEFKNGSSPDAREYLDKCRKYAKLAISSDSVNAFAWSTLGEYYGFKYMISKHNRDLRLFIKCEKEAHKYSLPEYDGYSFEIETYTDSEPYCYIKKKHPKEFSEIAKTERFYGRKNFLRRIRIY